MRRGELSNRSAPVCAVDWRVLLESPKGPVGHLFTQMMLGVGFEEQVRKMLPIRDGAVRWLERAYEARVSVFSIGVEELAPAIDLVLHDLVVEIEHFSERHDFLLWMKQNPQVAQAFTVDRSLVTLDGSVKLFSGWNQKVLDGL